MLKWKQIESPDGVLTIELSGAVDDRASAPLLELARAIKGGPARLVCEKLTHLNSIGVAAWMTFRKSLPPSASLRLARCSQGLTEYALMLPGLLGKATIYESFVLQRFCPNCDANDSVHITAAELVADTRCAERPCTRCGDPGIEPAIAAEELQTLAALVSSPGSRP